MEVADFNSLIALSQEHQVPIYALDQKKIGQQGAIWDQTKENMDAFEDSFKKCANIVIKLTS